jgi:hypothetical protein
MLTRTTSVVNIGYRRADKEIRSSDCVDAIWNFRVWMNAPLGCLDEPQTCPSILLSVWCRHPLLVTGSDLVTSRTDRHTKGGSPHWSCRQHHHSIRPPPPPDPPTHYIRPFTTTNPDTTSLLHHSVHPLVLHSPHTSTVQCSWCGTKNVVTYTRRF